MESHGIGVSGASWGVLGRVWASLGRLGASLEHLWGVLGRLRGVLGRVWGVLGRYWGVQGVHFGPPWPPLGTILAPFWRPWSPIWPPLARGREMSPKFLDVLSPFDLMFAPKSIKTINIYFNENPTCFLLDFRMVLGLILGWFLRRVFKGFRKSLGEAWEKRDPTSSPPLPMKTEVGQFRN